MKKLRNALSSEGGADVMSSVSAIIVGLLVGFVILLISNPSKALGGFGAILTGGFSDMKSLGQVLYFAVPIIMTGLSVGFANKTGLFNIGASGQFIMGAYVAILIGVKLTVFNNSLHWIIALLAATAAGFIWGMVPGLLNAFFNVNEVIACIMMNYIGMYLVNYLIPSEAFGGKIRILDTRINQTQRVASSAVMPKMGLDKIFHDGISASSANSGIIFAIIFGILIYIVLDKTKFGYELKACGFNRDAAQYAGINENRNIILSMAIAGALAGLGGGLLYLAGSGKGIDVKDVMAQEGFDGIPVALLGLNNPIGIIFSGLFIGYLTVGGSNMQLHGFVPEIIDIIVAVIIYFSAFALVFKQLFMSLGKKKTSVVEAEMAIDDDSAGEEDE